eukprot:GILI01012709.1.p1 GENE.GILI01012709.1~~GILI01012709.1.p1  ORF type:complete len:303 (-),score=-14.70 GILI01012709.1:462-1370(-)
MRFVLSSFSKSLSKIVVVFLTLLYVVFFIGSFVRDDDVYAEIVNDPVVTQEVQPAPQTVFYFGVTVPQYHDKVPACQETWSPRLRPGGIVWYSTAPDPRFNPHIVLVPQGDGYSIVFFRMLAIWKHVWENYPGYDWYSRVWDDVYIIKENVEELIKHRNGTAELVELGRVATAAGHTFVGGGATSLVSAAAVKALVDHIDECYPYIQTFPELGFCHWHCDDVFISMCRARYGVKFEHIPGYHAQGPRALGFNETDLSCHLPHAAEPGEAVSIPKTFHRVNSEEMRWIDRMWYGTPCNMSSNL